MVYRHSRLNRGDSRRSFSDNGRTPGRFSWAVTLATIVGTLGLYYAVVYWLIY